MRVAVIGAGISGIAAADALSGRADVTVFEAASAIGGHTDTHAILAGSRLYRVDSGFIVFNAVNYPQFSAWLAELGVPSQDTDMSFGVMNRRTGLEYGSRGLRALFCQRRNLGAPRYLRMLADIRRFYREALLLDEEDGRTLGEFLAQGRYGGGFEEDHLVPMCAALWSLPAGDARTVPVAHVAAFMKQHRMLQFGGRPDWRVVAGGSGRYLEAFQRRFPGTIHRSEPVSRVLRQPGRVVVETPRRRETFDAVVMACHSDQALAVLGDASVQEQRILGAIRYRQNRAVVHSDRSVMPRHRAAWSSWNVAVDGAHTEVSYWMNRLQSLDPRQPFFVTLNPQREPRDVWSERSYAHPVFDTAARAAQRRRAEISGVRGTYYCGAYWGWGFHEDGFVSGREAAADVLREVSRVA